MTWSGGKRIRVLTGGLPALRNSRVAEGIARGSSDARLTGRSGGSPLGPRAPFAAASCRRDSTADSRARGFTLLEVMLAILLLALLLAGTFGAIRTAVHAVHSGEARIDRINRLRVAQVFVRRQISHIMPLAFGQDQSTNTNLVFEGQGNFMRFVAPMPGYLSKGGPYVQTLALVGNRRGGKQLLFTDSMLNGFDPDAKAGDNEPSVLLDQIDDGRFEYRTLDDQGQLTDWSDKWDDPSVTPVMVRIVMQMSADAHVDFPEMEIPLILDVGAAHSNRPGSTLQLPGGVQPRAAQ